MGLDGAGREDVGPADAEPVHQFPAGGAVVFERAEHPVAGRRNVDDPGLARAEVFAGVAGGELRDRQQQVGALQAGELLPVEPLAGRVGGEEAVGVMERYQVIEGGRGGNVGRERADAGGGIIDEALEDAGDMDDVGPKAREERFVEQPRPGLPRRVRRVVPGDRRRRFPDMDGTAGQEVGEGFADRLDRFGEKAVQGKDHLVRAAVAGDGAGQRKAVAADAARAAGGLGALHVDDDAHQRALRACLSKAAASADLTSLP